MSPAGYTVGGNNDDYNVDDDYLYYYDDAGGDGDGGGGGGGGGGARAASSSLLPAFYCDSPLFRRVDTDPSSAASAAAAQMIPVLRDFPEFTPCFQHAVLDTLPALFFLLALPIVIVHTRRAHTAIASHDERAPPPPLPHGLLSSTRHALTTSLIGLSAFLFAQTTYEWFWLRRDDVALVEFVFPALQIATLVGLLWAAEAYRRAGQISPGVPCLTWLLFALCGAPEFARWIRLGTNPETVNQINFFRYLDGLCWYPLCLLQLLLHLFVSESTGRRPSTRNETPETRASFLSRVFYCWMDALILLGYRKPLTTDDVYRLEEAMRSQSLYRRWTTHWERKLAKWRRKQEQALRRYEPTAKSADAELELVLHGDTDDDDDDECAPLLHTAAAAAVADAGGGGGGGGRADEMGNGAGYSYGTVVLPSPTTTHQPPPSLLLRPRHKPSAATTPRSRKQSSASALLHGKSADEYRTLPSVVGCLWALFGTEFLGGSMVKFISDMFNFASPMLLNAIITFTEQPAQPMAYGLLLAGTLFMAAELRSIFFNKHFEVMNRLGTKVQSVLTAAVYAKTLRLSHTARQAQSSGEIVNLMAIDVARFQTITPLLQLYWSNPFQIVIILYMLYQVVGWTFVGGLATIIALVPCNFLISLLSRRLNVEQMQCKDRRLRLTNELLQGIRVVKLYAWEEPMIEHIRQIRQREVTLIRHASLLRLIVELANMFTPFLVGLITFALYIFSDPAHNVITPQIAFVSLTLFSMLRMPMIMFAELITQTVQMLVSNRRLKAFLVADEVDNDAAGDGVERDPRVDFYERAIDVRSASFDWDAARAERKKHSFPAPPAPTPYHVALHKLHEQQQHQQQPQTATSAAAVVALSGPFTLNNIDMHVVRGRLVAIVGAVGAGKSSLLMALLGELHKVYGFVGLRGHVAYCPQQSWILNRSLRENIVLQPGFSFARAAEADNHNVDDPAPSSQQPSFDADLYEKVVDACALRPDFAMLPHGDRTEIGEKGINLSGGQKARIALARALYRRPDVFLLDDPLSAVDQIVGRHLFQRAIGPGSLAQGATRLLVTHHVKYLPECDWIVVIENKRIKRQGTYADLIKDPEAAKSITEIQKKSRENAHDDDGLLEDSPENRTDSPEESRHGDHEQDEDGEDGIADEAGAARFMEPPSSVASSRHRRKLSRKTSEKRRRSVVGGDAAGRARRRSRGASSETAPSAQQLLPMPNEEAASAPVVIPASAAGGDGKMIREETAETGRVSPQVYARYISAMGPALFIGFAVFFAINSVLNVLSQFWLSAWADDNSPIPGVAKTPEPVAIRMSVYGLLGAATVLTQGLATICQIFGGVRASIRLHQPLLQRIVHAPVAFFDTTPLGRILNRFGKEFDTVDLRLASSFRMLIFIVLICLQAYLVCKEAPGFEQARLTLGKQNLNTVVVVVSIATPAILLILVPLTVVYVLILRYFIASSRQLQRLTSVTRSPLYVRFAETIQGATSIRAYALSQQFFHVALRPPPRKWPHAGVVHFRNFACRYRPGLPLALRSVSISFRAGERVGVVGRTGAGKSSLALALLRIVEPAEGRVLVDELDLSVVPLTELRRRLTVIPQDPVLFSGTLRFNLDPFSAYTDADLWTALEHAHLRDFVRAQHRQLLYQISENGENLSVGQRQLLCLARAILRRSALVIMDEATASVDIATDQLIQETIRTEFAGSTLLTIAHRVSTVLDYDRVLVLDAGTVVEFDEPRRLMDDRTSVFYGIATATTATGTAAAGAAGGKSSVVKMLEK